jgi:hypothetical protein
MCDGIEAASSGAGCFLGGGKTVCRSRGAVAVTGGNRRQGRKPPNGVRPATFACGEGFSATCVAQQGVASSHAPCGQQAPVVARRQVRREACR